MKAVVAAHLNPGDPLSALEIREMPEPQARPYWSRIAPQAVSVNHHDVWSLMGVGLSEKLTPMILGTDLAGTLMETPEGKTEVKEGDDVVAYTVVGMDGAGVAPGERRTILSEKYPGTMAEQVAVPSANIFTKPANLSVQEAAILGTSWLTAYSMLFSQERGARVRPGDRVLIQGAGGGVATAAIQMAHAAGLEVFVTSRSEERAQAARSLGADVAVLTGERLPTKVDAVLDSVGEATWSHSVKCVRPGGTIVTCGATTSDQPGAELTRVFFQDIRIQGNTMGTRDDFARMLRFVEHADLHPVVDSVFPMDQAHSAFHKLLEGNVFGKVVLNINAPQR